MRKVVNVTLEIMFGFVIDTVEDDLEEDALETRIDEMTPDDWFAYGADRPGISYDVEDMDEEDDRNRYQANDGECSVRRDARDKLTAILQEKYPEWRDATAYWED